MRPRSFSRSSALAWDSSAAGAAAAASSRIAIIAPRATKPVPARLPPMDQLLQFMGQHPVLFSALGVVVLLLILNEMSGVVTGEKRLSPLEAVRLINDRHALVLDVRTPADFKKGHILNAVNVPHTRLGERVDELGKDPQRPIVVCCALGGTAAQAAHTLKKAGFAEVYPIRGGLNGWLSASLPVTTR
jgi:rhodanese-related sulfurtransferase